MKLRMEYSDHNGEQHEFIVSKKNTRIFRHMGELAAMDGFYFDMGEKEMMMFRHEGNYELYDQMLNSGIKFPEIEVEGMNPHIAEHYAMAFDSSIPDTVPIEWQKRY